MDPGNINQPTGSKRGASGVDDLQPSVNSSSAFEPSGSPLKKRPTVLAKDVTSLSDT